MKNLNNNKKKRRRETFVNFKLKIDDDFQEVVGKVFLKQGDAIIFKFSQTCTQSICVTRSLVVEIKGFLNCNSFCHLLIMIFGWKWDCWRILASVDLLEVRKDLNRLDPLKFVILKGAFSRGLMGMSLKDRLGTQDQLMIKLKLLRVFKFVVEQFFFQISCLANFRVRFKRQVRDPGITQA